MARPRVASRPAVIPLGSLTQPGSRDGGACSACGSDRVTKIGMSLTDGSRVEFVSCHRCERRGWTESGQAVSVNGVLDKVRKR